MYIYTVTVTCSFIILLVFFLSCLYWSPFFSFFFSLISTSFFLLSHSSFIFASMGLINLFFSHSLPVGPLRRRRLQLEWVWSTLGFCLNGSGFRLDLGFGSDQPWEWEMKKSQSLGLRDLGFDLMVARWWWRWLGLRERERKAMSEKIIKKVKELIFYWINKLMWVFCKSGCVK